MTASTPSYSMLLDLAKEISSDKRRELLRQITNVFHANPAAHSAASYAAFDDIASAMILEFASEARSELATFLSQSALPLGRTARHLAMDEIAVAAPVLEGWNALTEATLLEVVKTKSQEHMIALTKRAEISEKVSDALVTHGEDHVVASLLSNKGARLDRETYEKVTERAQSSDILQAPLVRRKDAPLDLLNELYTSVASELRKEILSRHETASPEELDAAMARCQSRVYKKFVDRPDDLKNAERQLKIHERAGELTPFLLIRLMREGQKSRTLFLLVFARMTEANFDVISRLMDGQDVDALAVLCRAAGFDKAFFVTLCLSIVSEQNAKSRLDELGPLYDSVPVLTAQRAVRFWKVCTAAA